MKKHTHPLGQFLLAFLCLSFSTPAKAVDTTWSGSFGNWNDSLSWSDGVPNNGVDDFNAFVPEGWITVNSAVTIDNLEVGGSGNFLRLSVQDTIFTVLDTTTASGPQTQTREISASAISNSSIVDLGSFAGFMAGTLANVSVGASGSGAFNAVVQWQGAEIQTIAANAGVSLQGANSSIRNSLDSSNALVGLQTNEGRFQISELTFTTAGDFSNTGTLTAFSLNGNSSFVVNGTLAQNVGGVLTDGQLNLTSLNGFSSVIEWEGAEIHTIGSDARLYIQGADAQIRNSLDSSDALAGFHTNEGSLQISDRNFALGGDFSNSGDLYVSGWNADAVVMINGNLSNTGYLSVEGDGFFGDADGSLVVNGTLAQNVAGVLTAGSLSVAGRNGDEGSIEWEGAEIHTVGAQASVRLEGDASFIRDSLDSSDALAGLQANEGEVLIRNRSFVAGDDFSNTGFLGVEAWSSASSFVISGTLAQNSAGVLTGGRIDLISGNGFSSVIEWEGAEIHTIGEDAAVSLQGADSLVRDSVDLSDALADLHTNEGSFMIFDRDFTTAGDFDNSGYLYVGDGELATSAGGAFSLDSASLVVIGISDALNFGTISAEGGVTLDGDFSVSLTLANGFPNVDSADTFEVISGLGIAGTFDNIASGERLVTEDGGYSFLFTVTGSSVFLSDFSVVPEPGVASLIIFGAGLFCIRRRRRWLNGQKRD